MIHIYRDLRQERNPDLRHSLIGTWFTLKYGENDDRFPAIKQSDSCSWELSDHTIEMEFKSVNDMNSILFGMLGDFSDNLVAIPGCPHDLSLPTAYLRGLQHLATTQYFRPGGQRGRRRFRSLGNKSDTESKKRWKEWEDKTGREPVHSISACVSTDTDKEGNPIPYTFTFVPYDLGAPSKLHLKQTPKGALQKSQAVMNTFHPALGKWNEHGIKAPWEDAFFYAFSPAAFIYVLSDEGAKVPDLFGMKGRYPVGLGIDASSFPEADALRRRWWSRADNPYILRVRSNDHTALWMMASILNLPDRMYRTVSYRGMGYFRPKTMHYKTSLVYEIFRDTPVTILDRNRTLAIMRSLPVKVIKTNKKRLTTSIHDVLIRNLERGDAWCRGLAELITTNPKPNRTQKRIVTLMFNQLGDPMEREVARQMNWNYNALVRRYHDSDPNKDWEKARKRAQDFFKIHLSHAYSKADIILGLQAMMDQHPNLPGLKEEHWAWVMEKAETDPDLVRGILLAGRAFCNPKKEKKEEDGVPDTDTEPDNTDAIIDTGLAEDSDEDDEDDEDNHI